MQVITQAPNTNCCPQLFQDGSRMNLQYLGAAYPETLRCIESVGCHSSSLYSDVLKECVFVCPNQMDQTNSRSICLAQFNSATLSSQISAGLLLTIIITTAAMLI